MSGFHFLSSEYLYHFLSSEWLSSRKFVKGEGQKLDFKDYKGDVHWYCAVPIGKLTSEGQQIYYFEDPVQTLESYVNVNVHVLCCVLFPLC